MCVFVFFFLVVAEGLNDGIMLMNLTRLRGFGLEERVFFKYSEYKAKIGLTEMDVLNIIFNEHPDKVQVLPCSYTFSWSNCGGRKVQNGQRVCLFEKKEGPVCFCKLVFKTGVHLVHGTSKTFSKGAGFPLFSSFYSVMSKVSPAHASRGTNLFDLKLLPDSDSSSS